MAGKIDWNKATSGKHAELKATDHFDEMELDWAVAQDDYATFRHAMDVFEDVFTADKEEANFNRALKYSMEGKILQDHPDDEYGQLKFNVIGRFASMSDPSIPIVRDVLKD